MLADDGTIEEVHEFEFAVNDRKKVKGPRMVLTFADRNHANIDEESEGNRYESMDDEETEYLDHVKILPGDGDEPDDNIVDNSETDVPHVAEKTKKKRKIKLEVKCSLCNLMLLNKRSLKLHFKTVHAKNRVKSRCQVCYRRFKSPELLESHVLNVHTEQCPNCLENITEKARWVQGKRVQDTVDCFCGTVVAISKTSDKDKGSFSCMDCGVLFRSQWQLQRHQAQHTNESIKCYLCQNNFKNKMTLMKHLSTLHKVYVNRCKYCGKNYGNEMSLNVHISKVHCDDTVAPFSVESDAEEGNVMQLSQADWNNLTGSEPKRKAEDKTSDSDSIGPMGTERKKIKWKDNREQTCEQCGQVIKGKQALQAHIRRVHLKEKNHHCKICSKGFYANSIVENHMLTVHTRICDRCKEAVVEKEPWIEHMTVRTLRKVTCQCGNVVNIMSKVGGKLLPEAAQDEKGENLYQCATCGQLFSTRSQCEKHQRSHDLVCRLCAKTFTMKSSLARHMEKIHNMQTQPCQFCQKNFSSEYSLTLHLRKTHNYHGIVDQANASQIQVVQDVVAGPENAEITVDLTGLSYSSVDLNS
ncbi:hypothetical protein DPMN_036498 [Dreissena polymorpha]|uniref:C2H2-type domain-containing protein n=2 Tax=Dreissena polymorpha TaxID=45954 RepID=A0A9D4MD30_DREPO|nr:hypothetical protein DPMN_036498 [Dreissena polymorpha]